MQDILKPYIRQFNLFGIMEFFDDEEDKLLNELGMSRTDVIGLVGKKRERTNENEYKNDRILAMIGDVAHICRVQPIEEKFPDKSTMEYSDGTPITDARIECKVEKKFGDFKYVMIDTDPKGVRVICRGCRLKAFGKTKCPTMKSVRFIVDDVKTEVMRKLLKNAEEILNNN